MDVRQRPHECERARALVSTALDLELDELGSTFLHTHLSRCEHCSAFRSEVEGFTLALRSAPLAVTSPVVVPSKRRRFHGERIRIAAAAAAVAAVGVGGLFASLERRILPASPSTPVFSDNQEIQRALAAYRRSVVVARSERGAHSPHAGPMLEPY